MATDSQGNTFVFAGTTYTATNVSVTYGGNLLDTSHLGLATNAARTYQTPALRDDELSVDYIGSGLIALGASGALSFATIGKNATVSASSVTYATGELVKGSVTLKLN